MTKDFLIISVVMAVYNGQPYLSQAIESILNQTLTEFEFIIIDDGSTDGSLDIIQSYAAKDSRIRILQNENNIGHSSSLNKGILAARGKYIARMDADDISMHVRLEKQIRFLENHLEVGLCGTQITWMKNDLPECICGYPCTHPEIICLMVFRNPFSHPTIVFRRELFLNLGLLYDPQYVRAEDYELWERALQHVQSRNLEESLLLYRLHPGQVSEIYFEKQLFEAKSVQQRYLNKLGIKPTQDELDFHYDMSFSKLANTPENFFAAESWLNKLRSCNKEALIYPQPYFDRLIDSQLLEFCRSVMIVLKDKIAKTKFDYPQGEKAISIKERIKYDKLYQALGYRFQTMKQAMFLPCKRRWRNRNVSQNLKVIHSSVYFDEKFYLINNPDLGKAKIDPATHYLYYGGFEGRAPSPYFDSSWYLNTHSDVRLAGINPLIHYLRYGLIEGRSIHPNPNNTDTPIINSNETMKDGVSIVVCCHNSELLLPTSLKYLSELTNSDAIPIELILIDNASEDETSKVAEELWPEENSIPLRIIYEPNLGLSYARQRGLREAAYEFVSFIDDDNWLSANWVDTVYRTMKDHPDVGICGGLNKCQTESVPPWWFNNFKHAYAVGAQGSQSGDVTERKFVYGAGLTLRKSVWQKIVAKGFQPLLIGRQGTSLSAGEDSEICHAFILEGWKLWYEENLILTHFLPEQRLNWNYLRKMHRGFGTSDAILGAYQQVINGETQNKLAPGESFWFNRVNCIVESLKKLEEKVFVYQLDSMEGDKDVLIIDTQVSYLFEMYRIKDDYDHMVKNIYNLFNST